MNAVLEELLRFVQQLAGNDHNARRAVANLCAQTRAETDQRGNKQTTNCHVREIFLTLSPRANRKQQKTPPKRHSVVFVGGVVFRLAHDKATKLHSPLRLATLLSAPAFSRPDARRRAAS